MKIGQMATARSTPRRREAAGRRTAVSSRHTFDLLLKNGRVIDPANGLDANCDVGIRGGKIVSIDARIPRRQAAKVRDVSGLLVLPGLIDTHAHVFEHVAGDFGLNPDAVGVRSGVTTVVDQGGPSALTINGFRKFIVEGAKANVLCFISAYLVGGLHGHRYVDLYGPHGINVKALISECRKNRDIVRGIKVHAEPGGYSRWGVDSLKLAKKASRELGIPVYIHLGTLWPLPKGAKVKPSTVIDEMAPLLDEGDILAHPFTKHPSGFMSRDGEIHPLIIEALERGVRIDVGRGSHFSFEAAKAVIGAGITPFTLGADLHGLNVRKGSGGQGTWRSDEEETTRGTSKDAFHPTFSLYTGMSEMLALGVPEIDVIKMVTSNAAEMLGMSNEIGSLRIGRKADVSVVALKSGRFTLKDGGGAAVPAKKRFRPTFAVRDGHVMELDSPLLPKAERPAKGPRR